MPIDHKRFLQVSAILGAIFAYATIVVGGTVRGIPGAGVACPDWPLCNGSVVPDLADTKILVEYVHRLVAALTGVFMLSALAAAVIWFRTEMRIVALAVMSFAILVTQVAVGALTVTSDNNWVVVTIHLALGTATLASALIVALVSLSPTAPAEGASAA
jgi:heme A synthase